jgi:hypothetical protein
LFIAFASLDSLLAVTLILELRLGIFAPVLARGGRLSSPGEFGHVFIIYLLLARVALIFHIFPIQMPPPKPSSLMF